MCLEEEEKKHTQKGGGDKKPIYKCVNYQKSASFYTASKLYHDIKKKLNCNL